MMCSHGKRKNRCIECGEQLRFMSAKLRASARRMMRKPAGARAASSSAPSLAVDRRLRKLRRPAASSNANLAERRETELVGKRQLGAKEEPEEKGGGVRVKKEATVVVKVKKEPT